MNKQELYQVPIPRATDSYSPVSHQNIIETVEEQLDKVNLFVEKSTFNTGRDGKQLIGYMDIKSSFSELGMRVAFRNSYDKSMSVAFVAGNVVWICGNGMISGEIQYMRKHTGNVVSELNTKIINTINQLDDHFQRMFKHAEQMKDIQVDKTAAAELCGRMFVEQDLISSTQLGIIKRELSEPSFQDFTNPNLWSLYNHTTYSLKEAHPTHYIQDHIKFHEFIEKEYQLV